MRGAILPLTAALALVGCATTPATTTAALHPRQADYSQLSCKQLAAELALTQRAYSSASKRERQPRANETAQAFMFPASLGAAPPAASASLLARIEDLRRASRAKRCGSISKATTA